MENRSLFLKGFSIVKGPHPFSITRYYDLTEGGKRRGNIHHGKKKENVKK